MNNLKEAILVKINEPKISGFCTNTSKVYHLVDEDKYIYISTADGNNSMIGRLHETMIFECNSEGEVQSWSELHCIREINIIKALNEYGYYESTVLWERYKELKSFRRI